MDRSNIVERIIQEGVVGVIRMDDSKNLLKVAEAILKGGISLLEITMTTPNALQVIEICSKEMGREMLIGVGSVLDSETARLAIMAGAKYVVSPVTNKAVIQTAHRYDVPKFRSLRSSARISSRCFRQMLWGWPFSKQSRPQCRMSI